MISNVLLIFTIGVGVGSIAMMWSLVGDGFFPLPYAWPFTGLFVFIMGVSCVAWYFEQRQGNGRRRK